MYKERWQHKLVITVMSVARCIIWWSPVIQYHTILSPSPTSFILYSVDHFARQSSHGPTSSPNTTIPNCLVTKNLLLCRSGKGSTYHWGFTDQSLTDLFLNKLWCIIHQSDMLLAILTFLQLSPHTPYNNLLISLSATTLNLNVTVQTLLHSIIQNLILCRAVSPISGTISLISYYLSLLSELKNRFIAFSKLKVILDDWK